MEKKKVEGLILDTLRIAICEDEELERQDLLQLLKESTYATQVTLFSNGEDFLAQFHPCQYDLILMDIFMAGVTGIQVITQVRAIDREVPVAFITSSQAYTLESWRLNALKYIEKPATLQSIEDALQMAQFKQQSVGKLSLRINNTAASYPLAHILYLEQSGRTLLIHLLNGTVVSTNKKISEVEAQLVGKGFQRCHKSYLVNLAFVRGIDRELSIFEMSDGSKVHIRKRGFWEIQKSFEAYLFASSSEMAP